jgi:hypothetical protein
MTAPMPGVLHTAETDLHTAQSEPDPRRQGQYARSAADAAAEVAMDDSATAEERERAVSILRASKALVPASRLREADDILSAARTETDSHQRRALARSALAKAREAVRHCDVTDEERAQARQVIGAGRMIVNTILETSMRRHGTQQERDRAAEPWPLSARVVRDSARVAVKRPTFGKRRIALWG